MTKTFLTMLFMTICGCTYHWQSKDPVTPVSYNAPLHRSAESVGNLRRLALMPLVLEVYEGRYGAEEDRQAAALSYAETCRRFLTEDKGYEMVFVSDVEGKWSISPLKEPGYENLQDLHQEWHKERVDKHTASVVQRIGGVLNVDGILVVWIRERKEWGALEGILNIALLNVPLFTNIASPDTGAWIYETASGQIVWREERSARPPMGPDTPIEPVTDSLIQLFKNLENAVPRQLTE